MTRRQESRVPEAAREALLNDPDFLREVVQGVLQRFLEAKMSEHLQATPHQRTEGCTGYRNGYKSRQLKTRVGVLELLVPQDPDGTFKTELFERYQRSERALVLSLMGMYVKGVSTRKVREVTDTLWGTSFNKSQVSRLAGGLQKELVAWRKRPLGETTYPYRVVHACYEHVRQAGRVVSQGVLVVMGVPDDGRRDLLAADVADSESEGSYDALFRALKVRGLSGVQLVTSDEHRGLVAAVRRHFQAAAWQRCQVHFQRNAAGKVAKKHRKALTRDLKAVFTAPGRTWALDAAREVVARWRGSHPAAADWIEESIEETLGCFSFPETHRRRIRTTNGLERFNQELKRRTRVVRIFPNRDACSLSPPCAGSRAKSGSPTAATLT